jgi:hypothetical protein
MLSETKGDLVMGVLNKKLSLGGSTTTGKVEFWVHTSEMVLAVAEVATEGSMGAAAAAAELAAGNMTLGAGLGAWLGLASGVGGGIAGMVGPWLAIGAGEAEAEEEVELTNAARGFAIGVVAGVIGKNWRFVRAKFWVFGAYGADRRLAKVATKAHNQGLQAGFKEALDLSEDQAALLRKDLITRHRGELAAQGRSYVDPGNDADRIREWAGAFIRAHMQ